jgi:hypothetical protein
METTNANKMEGDAQEQEGEQLVAELQRPSTVTTGLEVFDCPVCFKPLGPPIFQVHALTHPYETAVRSNQ